MLFDFLLPGSKGDNILVAADRFLRALKIRVTGSSLKQTLQGHPDYPSMLSVSDSLKKWNIDNVCLLVEKERIAEVPLPFMAYTNLNGGSFLTVYSISENGVACSGYKKTFGKDLISRELFLKEWTGVCLLAEVSAQSGEKDYASRRIKEFLQENTAALIVLGCLVWMGISFPTIPLYLLSWIKFAGCFATALLLWYEIDGANPVLEKICTAVKNTNCKAVVLSKAANFLGFFSWSEIGFFYFAGSFIYLLVYPAGATLNLLSWLNLLALPYTVFSVIYQWRVVKQWCVLCLAVQGLLIGEFITFFFLFWRRPVSHTPAIEVYTLPVFFIPVFFWTFSKAYLVKAKTGERDKAELARLKSNKQIFEALIPKQKAIPAEPMGLGIILGDTTAANTIIKVCNPYCNPCAKAHPLIDELLETRKNLKVQIIFTAKDDDNDHRANPVRHLMALQDRRDQRLMHQALDDWYLAPEKNYDSFASKYPLNGELQLQGGKLKAMNEWCMENGISFTPTFFINGYQLPEIYSVGDLRSFLNE